MSENSRIYPSFNPSAGTEVEFRSSSFPDCHWRLCRQFLDRYRSLLPAEQLYALAHIFANTQLLLRGDTTETMELVMDLVRDQLPAELDCVENNRWERAAEPDVRKSIEALEISEPECPKVEITVDLNNNAASGPDVEMNETEPLEKSQEIVPEAATKFIRVVPTIPLETVYKNLILFDNNFEKTLLYFNRLNCGTLKMSVKQNADLQYSAAVKLDRQVLIHASGKKRPHALSRAVQLFFANMQDHCYRIESIPSNKLLQLAPNVIRRQTIEQPQVSPEERINESNVGFRMLQKIGWTGGPLGVGGTQGRLDPVECGVVRKGRPGIGAVVPPQLDVAHYRKMMKQMLGRKDGCHLVFSEDFSSGERAELQRISSQLRLDGRVFALPHGVKHFVVLARELPPQDIVRRVLLEKDANLSAQYRVIPPKMGANSLEEIPSPEIVPECQTVSESMKVPANIEDDSDSQLSCGEDDLSPTSKLISDDQILASLTQFKPVRPLRTIEDVYHNVVIIGSNFKKTLKAFKRVGCTPLELRTKPVAEGGFYVRISTGSIVLVEARDQKKSRASSVAKTTFLKKAAMFSYTLTPKNPRKHMENAIARVESPKTNNGYYQNMIQEFFKDCLERELVFSTDFDLEERKLLQRTARALGLRSVCLGSKGTRHLRITGPTLPALAILERIVVQRDAKLSERYEVTPPRIGARLVEGGCV